MISELNYTLSPNRIAKRGGFVLTVMALALALVCAPGAAAQKATSGVKSHHATLDGARINYQSYGK